MSYYTSRKTKHDNNILSTLNDLVSKLWNIMNMEWNGRVKVIQDLFYIIYIAMIPLIDLIMQETGRDIGEDNIND